MKTKAIAFIIIIISPFNWSLKAQSGNGTKIDSASSPVDSTSFNYFEENGFPYGSTPVIFPLKNGLDNFQSYYFRQSSLGNAGSPQKNILLSEPPSIGFRRGINNFSHFGFLPENRKFYFSKKPYTKLQYIVSQKQEVDVSVIHAHPFGENCNIAFGFDRTRSTGFYKRQNTNNTSLNLNGWYRAPGKRYALLSDIYWTNENVAENGGIANDSSFEFEKQLDRQLVAVNLSDANSRQRLRGFWFKEYWSFGNSFDTLSDKNDSTDLFTSIKPSWAIVHTSSISDEKYAYNDGDPTSGFYENIFRDSVSSHDSTYLWKLENGLWLERFDQGFREERRFLSGRIGFKHEVGEISNDTIYSHFQNLFLDGSLKLLSDRRWFKRGNIDGAYCLTGNNKTDFKMEFHFETGSFSRDRLTSFIHGGIAKTQPDFIYRHYAGNFLRWENDFSQTSTSTIKGGIKTTGLKKSVALVAGFHQYTDVLYFDSTFIPNQDHSTFNAVSVQLMCKMDFDIFKFSTDITWNKMENNSLIRLPELVVRGSAYGNFLLFKRALHLQTGIDATWYSAFYADGYNPNISQFYVQDSEKIGNYIFIDPWLSIKVKSVRVFVKADHINAGWFGRTYFQVPHYPGNDLTMKFGISWVFND